MPNGRPIRCSLVLEGDPQQRLAFESFPAEDGIPEQYQSNWSPVIEGGASEPLAWKWTGGGWANWTLTLQFQAGVGEAVASGEDDDLILRQMEKKLRWLQALGAPRGKKRAPDKLRTNARPGDPPFVLVVLGSFMTLRCVCLGTSIRWTGPWDPTTVRPHGAKAEISLQRISGFYPDWHTIAEGKTTLTDAEQSEAIRGRVLSRVRGVFGGG